MEAMTKDLWVFVETNEDGTAKNVGIELLTPGRDMATKQGGELVAVVVGNNVQAAVDAVKKLSADVGIPADLKDIVKPEDVPFLAQSAYDDACRPGNPRETSVEEIKALYLSLM